MSFSSNVALQTRSGIPTVLQELMISTHVETYGVTKALEKLLYVIAQDALTFSRNIHSAYTAISIARYALDDIKALIKSVDKDEFSPVTWDNLVKYTTLIPLLENFCLSFERISHAESQATVTTGTISIAALSFHLAEWETKRKLLGDSLRGFPKDFVSVKIREQIDEIGSIQRHDDCVLFVAISAETNNELFPVQSGATKPFIDKTVENLTSLSKTLPRVPYGVPDEIFEYSIKTILIVQMIFKAGKNNFDGLKTANIRFSKQLWTLLSELTGLILTSCTVTTPTYIGQIQAKYDRFWTYLTGEEILAVPEGYKQLFKLFAGVQRPYYQETWAIVTACRGLAQQWEQLRVTVGGPDAFDQVIQRSTAALNAAGKAKFSPDAVFDYSAEAVKEVQDAITAAAAEIQLVHRLEKIEDTTKFVAAFGEARAKDRSRLADFKARLAGERPVTERREMVEIEVDIHAIGMISAQKMHITLSPKDTLDKLLYHVGSQLSAAEAAFLRKHGAFKKAAADQDEISSPTPVSALQEKVFLVNRAVPALQSPSQ